jgi:Ca2+-transporting ATPase
MIYHTKSAAELFRYLSTDERGLSSKEAQNRLRRYGFNKLPEAKTRGLLAVFLGQFRSPLIYILLAAGAVILFIGEITDSIFIFAVLIFNAIVGTIQEGRAQNILLALKKIVETSATVIRDGKPIVVEDAEVFPGDIIILQEGEKVPADARVIFSRGLRVDESSLTGESAPISKIPDSLRDASIPIADQKNMVFKGTSIVGGNGRAVVVATGLFSEIGKISQKIAGIDTEIPLKGNIRYLSRLIIITVLFAVAVLFIGGLISGKPVREMFASVVALSVSIIPEGLPIVMTLVLATGVWRMTKRNVLIKKLQAVEALGQARVIAVDKTGTITKNEMVVSEVYVNGEFFEIGGVGYEPHGEILKNGKAVDPLNHPELILSGKVAALCANAEASYVEATSTWKVVGDPTEAALRVFAEKIGFRKETLEQESPVVDELPFSYDTRYHATMHKVDNKNFLTVVGAPEKLLAMTKKILRGGKAKTLSNKEKRNLESVFYKMSQEGLRVVAFAINSGARNAYLASDRIPALTLVGLFGMKDTLRPEVKDALASARAAGMRVIMITGDHRFTAGAIAKEAGIYKEGDVILTGEELDVMTDEELAAKLQSVKVFARVTPDHKLKIIRAYRKRGDIIAMTGDGVNDAASLVAADLGVAMGKIGTEVAKEAADLVLLDDNFGSIMAAVEEGRGIYKTVKKVILYLFSTSVGEVLTIGGAIALGYILPVLPSQIIWLNFVTDGFLDVSLAMEPREKDLLKKNFEHPKRYLVDSLMAKRMIVMGVVIMVGTLVLFAQYLKNTPEKALTISLTTLAVFQWFNAWNCRSEDGSIFQSNPLSNKFLLGATFTIIALQSLAIYTPFMQKLLHTVPINFTDWLWIIAVSSTIIVVEEVRKFVYRKKHDIRT